MTPPSRQEMLARLGAFIDDPAADTFEAVGLDLFRHQYAAMPPLAAYWRSLGATPESVTRVADIPPVALLTFKRFAFFGGSQATRVFRTSGTSGQGAGVSSFNPDDLALMDRSILANARDHLFSDGRKTRFLMLVPAPEEAPHIIMAHGMRRIAAHFGLGEPVYAVRQGTLRAEEAMAQLADWTRAGDPVTLIGGSFGFVNFIEGLGPQRALCLPPGSRLLDAGGFKGRSRELDRAGFLQLVSDFFSLPQAACRNLYGLTELASQFYSQGSGPKQPAHWTAGRVCDPLSLRQVAPGEDGVAVLYDLANLSRPWVILTDDLARNHGQGAFDILGRASHSAPRGCSLSLEELR